AEAYAKLGIALADAFITCWHTKYVYNVLRPLTYIQQVIDPTWNTPESTDPVTTPPFPEYTSGHSVQSSAAAMVLASLFGDEYTFTDRTHDRLGMAPRSFSSFAEAANEAAISRIYGGIHYRSAVEAGLAQGQCVGERVLALRFR
ncbi:MAG TPA: vanadium-dependent haloperoxidase, partial [Caldilineaceae bacterium]|nr:vanadium-dependent haloperoxidase [Caldilineaceae bacterium]